MHYNRIKDNGPNPTCTDIEEDTVRNTNFRTVLWTGEHLQVTLMSIPVDGDIGLEIHPDTDQFLRIEEGVGVAMTGKNKSGPDYRCQVCPGTAILIPSGHWHNVVNTGTIPLKLYSIYAPPHHPHGAVHATKHDAEVQEGVN